LLVISHDAAGPALITQRVQPHQEDRPLAGPIGPIGPAVVVAGC
jgi:hypothetical protein